MREIDIPVPEGSSVAMIERAIENACKSFDLKISMRTLRPKGAIHWHLKNGKKSGTLELTASPSKRPLWAKIHAGRSADWIDEILPQFISEITADLIKR